MKEVTGDIWNYHKQGYWIVITTNGTIRSDGSCVMGRGVARQAADRFPDFPKVLGKNIKSLGNIPMPYRMVKLITFPVKHNWWEKADPKLIEKSCRILSEGSKKLIDVEEIYMVRPGCGNGGLDWKDVKPILEKYLDNRFIIVERSR